jgi:hypothetical protein
MESAYDFDEVKIRVEVILGKLLRMKVSIKKDDPRITSIHTDICLKRADKKNEPIPDEEILSLIKKYFRYKAVLYAQQIN